MDNSTATKPRPKAKAGKQNEDLVKHVMELGSKVDYILDILKNQAHVVQQHQSLLERIRNRMGI